MWLIIGVLLTLAAATLVAGVRARRRDSANKPRSIPAPEAFDEDAAARRHGRHMSGQYRLLYEYLARRYADTVVLTFAQMEDLIGFTLPDRASIDREWWAPASVGSAEPCHSNAWVLARRTAKPNLLAKNVVFERVPG